MAKCLGLMDATKCDLVIDTIHSEFSDFMSNSDMVHHNIEITTRCIDCDQKYYFTKSDLKVEDFGKVWRTAVFSKQYKP
jgi:hypothetical protein